MTSVTPDPEHYLRAMPHADGVIHYRRGHQGHGPKLCDYMKSWRLYTPGALYRDVRGGSPTCLWCMKWRCYAGSQAVRSAVQEGDGNIPDMG